MNRADAKSEILKITKKYNWDGNEEYKLDQLLKLFRQTEFESALIIKDAIIINRLEELVKNKAWKLIFNHDDADGFFAEVQEGYHALDISVADLEIETKRDTLRDAMIAAIEYLEHGR